MFGSKAKKASESKWEYRPPVTVLVPANPSVALVAKSLLEDAGIAYFVKGDTLQGMITLGNMNSCFDPILGPLEIQVAPEDAEEAALLLADLAE